MSNRTDWKKWIEIISIGADDPVSANYDYDLFVRNTHLTLTFQVTIKVIFTLGFEIKKVELKPNEQSLACTVDGGPTLDQCEEVLLLEVKPSSDLTYSPSVENNWEVTSSPNLVIDPEKLQEAIRYHDEHELFTKKYGGALVILYRGQLIGESYVTGTDGGPQPWTAETCNDMKSSTKSVFGTAAGCFFDEFKTQINLESRLVGRSQKESLLPQIWDQPLTDKRKKQIKVKHVLSMTSGHESREPWLAPSQRIYSDGYSGAYQMYEYCFGWWRFEGIPAQHTLLFEPGHEFNYSNFGLELLALAMKNISGLEISQYLYDRVLKTLGFPKEIAHNYQRMPYSDDRELNFGMEAGWGQGGSLGCNGYGADEKESRYGTNSIVGSTFRCTARDFAKLGQLWLNKGEWNGQQLVPAGWIKRATQRFVQADGKTPINYGYTFWLFDSWDEVPTDTFASLGHNVNDCYVIPSKDLVIVRQGNANHDKDQRDIFSQTLITKVLVALPSA